MLGSGASSVHRARGHGSRAPAQLFVPETNGTHRRPRSSVASSPAAMWRLRLRSAPRGTGPVGEEPLPSHSTSITGPSEPPTRLPSGKALGMGARPWRQNPCGLRAPSRRTGPATKSLKVLEGPRSPWPPLSSLSVLPVRSGSRRGRGAGEAFSR